MFSQLKKNRKLTIYLSINDFKRKYAGSYFGIVWAFVQPLITIILYWFVFEFGIRQPRVSDVPFILWLMAGLIPWFFFSEALMNATNCFTEYSYLVKKVLFDVNILPIVKVFSSLFVHVFFIAILILAYCISGLFPGIMLIQLIYYSICMIALVTAVSYLTSALAVFFKDTTQIIGIMMQVGIWVTPIMWDLSTMGIPSKYAWIFKLNPMYYIVSGYRDTMIGQAGFWERPYLTIYFWTFTLIAALFGRKVFRYLRPYFSDVL